MNTLRCHKHTYCDSLWYRCTLHHITLHCHKQDYCDKILYHFNTNTLTHFHLSCSAFSESSTFSNSSFCNWSASSSICEFEKIIPPWFSLQFQSVKHVKNDFNWWFQEKKKRAFTGNFSIPILVRGLIRHDAKVLSGRWRQENIGI